MTILLKNGTYTTDPRLTRIVHFDPKSKAFPISALIESTKPRSYTWPCKIHIDQKAEGSCVGHSVAHELAALPAAVPGMNHEKARSFYFEAQRIDQWPGGAYPGAYPFYEGTSVLAGVKIAQKLGYIKEYRWAFGLDDLILAVGRKGPAILGVNWYSEMHDVDQYGYIHAEGELTGGHAILCKGVNLKGQYFTLHNSWGTDWGINGDCKISFDDMDYLLHDDGEACIPVTRALPVFQQVALDFKNWVVSF